MNVMLNTLILLFLVPFTVMCLQVFFCYKRYRIALFFPIVVACFFFILGLYAIILALLMYAIYFARQYSDKQKDAKLSEITKMNIDDL